MFPDTKNGRSCFCGLLPVISILCLILLIGSTIIAPDHEMKVDVLPSIFKGCKAQCWPPGSEKLPAGIVAKTSNLDMRPLWGFPKRDNSSINLFAAAVGIKQSDLVDKMVKKFLSSHFVVMLFHYDGIVDEWKNFEWSKRVIHVSAQSQTKWWFAKRFLHPDIVTEYGYIFLWDEDLGVENFNPEHYLSIIKSEGLEISQPALDLSSSEVHHLITARGRESSIVHRRTFKPGVNGCDSKSMAPPCTGWIEMMAPVFSRAAWQCVWYMIQNDLIHAWGLDKQLGYCAQGDRTKTVGVVDAEYIVHYGRPTLGHKDENKGRHQRRHIDPRVEVRRQSYIELDIFQKRWKKAVEEDQCWNDPYAQ